MFRRIFEFFFPPDECPHEGPCDCPKSEAYPADVEEDAATIPTWIAEAVVAPGEIRMETWGLEFTAADVARLKGRHREVYGSVPVIRLYLTAPQRAFLKGLVSEQTETAEGELTTFVGMDLIVVGAGRIEAGAAKQMEHPKCAFEAGDLVKPHYTSDFAWPGYLAEVISTKWVAGLGAWSIEARTPKNGVIVMPEGHLRLAAGMDDLSLYWKHRALAAEERSERVEQNARDLVARLVSRREVIRARRLAGDVEELELAFPPERNQ